MQTTLIGSTTTSSGRQVIETVLTDKRGVQQLAEQVLSQQQQLHAWGRRGGSPSKAGSAAALGRRRSQ